MIKRLLIANRGEIAVRVIRACREMGIEAVVVYSTADAQSLPVRLADRAVCIGPPPASKSYLVKENLIMAALHTGCEAVHPGVGFLSESADFARGVEKAGLVFIGPRSETIELLGDKVRSRESAVRFGLPVTPGTEAALPDAASARKAAGGIGYPVIIKAAAGGGGKGMRVVREEAELEAAFALTVREAEAAFGDGRVFLERFIEKPRHVELQILADGKGAVAILGERDCSVQRNHQKLIEESPSPGVTDAMRETMQTGALRMFGELGYTGAGTIEFLVEGAAPGAQRPGGAFYFMEVNARVQVEHPVSEAVSGVDIIRQQILACVEGRLDIDPQAVRCSGAAIECRLNARKPGTVTRLEVPGGPGVRFDSALFAGCAAPPYYDSMLAKLITHAENREAALRRMERALDELVIEGIETNLDEQRAIIRHPVFQSGVFDTSFYERYEEELHGRA